MDLILLDENFQTNESPIDRFSFMNWTHNYYDSGSFVLKLSPKYFQAIDASEYIYNQDTKDTAIITNYEYTNKDGEYVLVVNGVSLKHLMNYRIIDRQINKNTDIESACYEVITALAMTGDRTIPLLTLAPKKGFTDIYNSAAERGLHLGAWLNSSLEGFEMSYDIKFDRPNHQLMFEVYKGLDRTENQSINSRAIFSTDKENITGFVYEKDSINDRNFLYIDYTYEVTNWETGATETRTAQRTIDQVGAGYRKEMYAKNNNDTTPAQRGLEILRENKTIEIINSDIFYSIDDLEYGIDYSLGDMVHLKLPEIGLSIATRVTSVEITYENNAITYRPKFGLDRPYEVEKIIKRELRNSGV